MRTTAWAGLRADGRRSACADPRPAPRVGGRAPLNAHGQGLAIVGVVISVHVAGMFAPAPFTGWLADRAAPHVVVLLGVSLLIAAGIGGALTADQGAATGAVVLTLLGVGWNCGVVGASSLLASSVPMILRSHVEGIGEAAMGVAAAIGAPLTGIGLRWRTCQPYGCSLPRWRSPH